MKRIPVVSPLGAAVCLLVLTLVSPIYSAAQSAAASRIVQAIDDSNVAVLHGNLNPRARPEFDQGPVNAGMAIKGASLNFKLSGAQQAALNELLIEQQAPGSPNYHKWITPEQYAARFGMSTADLNKVTGWLQSEGFTGITVSRNHNRVSFTGSAGQIESVFHTEIHNYLEDGETHYALAVEPSIPQAFAATVLGVRNLDDFRPKPRVRRPSGFSLQATPNFTSNISGNHYMAPDDFATIYDLQSLYSLGLDGTGVTLVVVGQTSISTTDTRAFRSAANLPAKDPTMTLVADSGTPVEVTDDEVEADLDVEWSGGVAKNATVDYVYVGNNTNFNVWDSLQDAIENDRAPVISTSYGFCEAGLGSAFVLQVQQLAQQANAQGQTITAASGDDGAADCDTGSSGTQGLAVDTPASVPEVTGVGGGEFSADVSSPSTYWNASNDASNGSAIEYIPETSWNDTTASIAAGNGLSASGGGASIVFGKPSWQTGTGVPTDGKRDVPDISFDASPDHDGYLICSNAFFVGQTPALTSCATTGSFRASDSQSLAVVGGTSVSSQVFGGVVAILNQATSSGGLGNVNPTLYSLYASTPAAFHDITTSNNIVPCTANTPNCPTSGTLQYGFSAGTGYDQVTGLGSLKVAALEAAWPGAGAPAATSDFWISGLQATVATPGQSATSTITVSPANGFTGTVNLTCAASSSTSGISCSLSPTSVTVNGSAATATLTINTTAASVITKPSASLRPHKSLPWLPASGGLLFAGVVLMGVPSRQRKSATMAMIVFACLVAWAGCGGGSSSSGGGGGGGGNSGTSAGSYIVTVTGTSGSTSHTTSIAVAVQ